jgi:antitoxin component of RelBE/YafQ-DinJ toxin-antitoxin module
MKKPERKEKLINLRVTEHERRRMAEIAKQRGMTLSELVRNLVLSQNREVQNETISKR